MLDGKDAIAMNATTVAATVTCDSPVPHSKALRSEGEEVPLSYMVATDVGVLSTADVVPRIDGHIGEQAALRARAARPDAVRVATSLKAMRPSSAGKKGGTLVRMSGGRSQSPSGGSSSSPRTRSAISSRPVHQLWNTCQESWR